MNTKTKKLSTVSMVLCGMFAALVAIGAFIQIPVPYMDYFTLQFFFVLLTIDSEIQTLAEKTLGNRVGAVVVLKPATGTPTTFK